jgi:hypothetical protein
MQQALTVTSGREWRQGYVRVLPSGKVVRLRKPRLLGLVKHGEAPDFLSGIIIAAIQGKPIPKIDMSEMDAETLASFTKATDKICAECFLEPRIVDKPVADDEIELADVDEFDKVSVLGWALGQEGALTKTFPGEPAPGAGAAPDSEQLPPAPESGIRPKK